MFLWFYLSDLWDIFSYYLVSRYGWNCCNIADAATFLECEREMPPAEISTCPNTALKRMITDSVETD